MQFQYCKISLVIVKTKISVLIPYMYRHTLNTPLKLITYKLLTSMFNITKPKVMIHPVLQTSKEPTQNSIKVTPQCTYSFTNKSLPRKKKNIQQLYCGAHDTIVLFPNATTQIIQISGPNMFIVFSQIISPNSFQNNKSRINY